MITTYDALLLAWQTITHRLNYTDTLDPIHAAWTTQAREALAAIDEALSVASRETTQAEHEQKRAGVTTD